MFFWNSLVFSMTQQMSVIWFVVPLPFLNLAWTSGTSWSHTFKLGVSLLPTFAFQSPIMKRTTFLGVSSKTSSWNYSTSASSALLVGHRVRLVWYWMVCLVNEQRSFCYFWDCNQVLHFWLLLTMRATPISFKGFLMTVADVVFIWIKSLLQPIFSSLLKCPCSLLLSPIWPLPICLDSWT